MTSGVSRPGSDRSQFPGSCPGSVVNAPELVVTLDSLGVAVLDTSHVPDVLGLKTRDADVEVIRVLPGRAQDSVRVLITDANVVACCFHDVTMVDMLDEAGRPSPWETWVNCDGSVRNGRETVRTDAARL